MDIILFAEFLVLSENFPSNKTSGNRQRSAKKKGRSKSCDAVEKNLAESSKDALGRRARDAKPTSGSISIITYENYSFD